MCTRVGLPLACPCYLQLWGEPAVAAAGPGHVFLAALGGGPPHLPPHSAVLPGEAPARLPDQGARAPGFVSLLTWSGHWFVRAAIALPASCAQPTLQPSTRCASFCLPVALQSPRNVTGSRSGLLKCFVRRENGPGGKRFTFHIGKDAAQPQRSRFLMAAKHVSLRACF